MVATVCVIVLYLCRKCFLNEEQNVDEENEDEEHSGDGDTPGN